jgi:hypothetical protein
MVGDNVSEDELATLMANMAELDLETASTHSSSQFYTPRGDTMVPNAWSFEENSPELENKETADESQSVENKKAVDEAPPVEAESTEEGKVDEATAKSSKEVVVMSEGDEAEPTEEGKVEGPKVRSKDKVIQKPRRSKRVAKRESLPGIKVLAAARRKAGEVEPTGTSWENHLLHEFGFSSEEEFRPSSDEESD